MTTSVEVNKSDTVEKSISKSASFFKLIANVCVWAKVGGIPKLDRGET